MDSAELQGACSACEINCFYNQPQTLKKKEMKKSSRITSIRIKYLGVNLIKEMQNLYIENYKNKVKGFTFPNFLVQSYSNPSNLVLV